MAAPMTRAISALHAPTRNTMARPKPKPKTARELRFELIAAKHLIVELREHIEHLTESLRQSRADAKALATLTR